MKSQAAVQTQQQQGNVRLAYLQIPVVIPDTRIQTQTTLDTSGDRNSKTPGIQLRTVEAGLQITAPNEKLGSGTITAIIPYANVKIMLMND